MLAEQPPAPAHARRDRRAPVIVLAVVLLGAGAWLYWLTRGTTFFQDEWVWVLYRRANTVATFLNPHNQHLSLTPLLIYRLLLATAGLPHYDVFRIVVTVAQLACVALVFAYARRRVGPFGATVAAALILFLGQAWQNILWPFQMAWLISLTCGLGALLMLDRREPQSDVAASGLLAVSLASSGIGLPVMLGIAAELAWQRTWQRLWIVAAPVILYGLWWLAYQQSARTSSAGAVPRFVVDELAATLASVTGLGGHVSGTGGGTLLTFGRPLAVIAVVLLVWRLVRIGELPPRVLNLLVLVGSFWLLTAISRAWLGPPEAWASRYLYVGALATVLLAVELVRGLSPPPRWALAVIAAAGVAIVASGASAMARGARYLRDQGAQARAELGAMDMTRGLVAPGYVSLVPNFPFPVVLAGPYFSAERADGGTPAATPEQLLTLPEDARAAADAELIQIHRVRIVPGPWRCAGAPRAVAGGELTLPPSGLVLLGANTGGSVAVARFASRPQRVGTLSPGARALLRIGPDRASVPWRIAVSGAVETCSLRGASPF